MKRILFYSSVNSLELFKTQKFYQIDISILKDLGYDVLLSNRIFDSLLFWKYDILFSYFYRYSFFAALLAKCFGKKTYFTGGIDSLDSDYASAFNYKIQALFFKLCYWVADSCIIVSQSDLKNIFKVSSLKKALQIFAELKKIPEFVDYRFVIIGRKGEGEVLVRSIIDKYNLKGSVELKGEVSEEDKINLLKQSKYYFQLSLYEGFGLAALEALCANNIIIHSGKGGLANPIYKEQLLFDIDNDFDSELLKLVNKLACFTPITSYDNLLEYYDIQRRKDDFEAIIVNGKSNYKLK